MGSEPTFYLVQTRWLKIAAVGTALGRTIGPERRQSSGGQPHDLRRLEKMAVRLDEIRTAAQPLDRSAAIALGLQTL